MVKTIISDTSCLISLYNIGQLHLLNKLFEEVYITTDIQNEFGLSLPNWIIIKNPTNSELLSVFYSKLDRGEASAIALALEIKNVTVIIDELKGRKFAESYNIKTVGTLGIMILAKEEGMILDLMENIYKMIENGFRISDILLSEIKDDFGTN